MYDGGKVIIGLLIFLIVATFPIWYNFAGGKADYRPQLEQAVKGEQCVRSTEYMREQHMDLLDEWRDQVVREGDRYETGEDGIKYERSLTHTCLDCHPNKDKFCDECHNYLSVEPYCWACHIVPKEVQYGVR
jgi:hypothetical protein